MAKGVFNWRGFHFLLPKRRMTPRTLLTGLLSLLVAFHLPAADAPPHAKLVLFEKGFNRPVALADDGSGRIFVVEHTGTIRLVDNGQVLPDPYLDIRDRTYQEGESGLLCVAFHPNFATNGRLFVNYDVNVNGQEQTVVSEFKANPMDKKVDPSTEHVLLRFNQPWTNHKGGQLAFGKDGYLYISTGDGGAGGDPLQNGQSLKTFLAKILRIDVNHQQPYAVPADNPFVNQAGALPEIYAYGMRNPWRFSFDRQTGQLYCGDVGQDKWEEVDIIEKGKNYGWSAKEGFHDFEPKRAAGPLTDPIKEYGHYNGDNCIIGGYVYRGKQFSDLQGVYIYGDNGSGRIWGLKWDGKSLTTDGEMAHPQNVHMSAFGEDKDGELYVVDYNSGVVYRLVE
jgi:glucose/arabinose dehydrogenase